MTDYQLTAEQNAAITRIDEEINAIKEREASTQGRIKAIEKFAQTYTGDENKPKRVTMLTALVGVAEDAADKTKTGVVNLGSAMVSRFLGEPIAVEITKVIKETEPAVMESETALATVFDQATKASKAIRALSVDELNVVNATAHTAFHAVLRAFGNIKIVVPAKDDKPATTKTVEIPAAAANFASGLVAASGGRTDPFMLTDRLIAERLGCSIKTVVRGRQALIDFMELIGKEIIKIQPDKNADGTPTGKGYVYTVALLESTTRAMYELLNSSNASPEVLTTVAAVSGKFLSGETAKLQEQLSESEFKVAEEMSGMLNNIVDELPAPVIEQTTQKSGQLKKALGTRLDKLGKAIAKAIDDAKTLDLKAVVTACEKLNIQYVQQRKKYTDDENITAETMQGISTILDEVSANLETQQKAIVDASTSAIEKAKANQADAAAAGTPKTLREVADEYYGMLPLPEQVEADLESRLEIFTETAYYIAAATDNLKHDKPARYLELQDVIQRAMGFGKYGTPTGQESESATA